MAGDSAATLSSASSATASSSASSASESSSSSAPAPAIVCAAQAALAPLVADPALASFATLVADALKTIAHLPPLAEREAENDAPGEAELTCAANQIGERHGAVSLTLELPMKGDGGGRVRAGWSPKRAVKAGESLVDVLLRARARLDET